MSLRPALALLVAVLATHAWALPAESRITAVTVYADSAVVTRSAPLDLTTTGNVEAVFEKLPSSLVDKSLQVVGRGSAQVHVRGATAQAMASKTPQPRPGETGVSMNRGEKNVIVRLEVTTRGHLELVLSYRVPNASWKPVYDAHVLKSEQAVQFGYFAFVRQKTGEDWRDVDLTLSTLNANGSRSREHWGGNTLSRVLVQPIRPASHGQPVAVVNGIPRWPSNETEAPVASFTVPTPSTVGGNDAATKVFIAATRLAGETEFLVVPWESRAAPILVAKGINTLAFPLLAGTVNLFLGDAPASPDAIRTVLPGESFELGLSSTSIAARRNLNNRTEDDGPLHQSWRITYDVTLTVENKLPTAEKVVLQERVPVPGISGSKKTIVVTLLTPTGPEAHFSANGLLQWKLGLGPREIREVPVKYSIEFLDSPIREGHVKIGELRIVDDRVPAPTPAKK